MFGPQSWTQLPLREGAPVTGGLPRAPSPKRPRIALPRAIFQWKPPGHRSTFFSPPGLDQFWTCPDCDGLTLGYQPPNIGDIRVNEFLAACLFLVGACYNCKPTSGTNQANTTPTRICCVYGGLQRKVPQLPVRSEISHPKPWYRGKPRKGTGKWLNVFGTMYEAVPTM